MFAVGDVVTVREGTTHDWLGHGDPSVKHWGCGKEAVVIRHSRTDVVLRVKFDRETAGVPDGANGCQWFHPDELQATGRTGDAWQQWS